MTTPQELATLSHEHLVYLCRKNCKICNSVPYRDDDDFWYLECPCNHTCDRYRSAILARQKREREKFEQHLKRASEIVSTWPEWKQNMLGPLEPSSWSSKPMKKTDAKSQQRKGNIMYQMQQLCEVVLELDAKGSKGWTWRMGPGNEPQLECNCYAPEMSPVLVARGCGKEDGCMKEKLQDPDGLQICPLHPSKDDRDIIAVFRWAAPALATALKFLIEKHNNECDEANSLVVSEIIRRLPHHHVGQNCESILSLLADFIKKEKKKEVPAQTNAEEDKNE